MVTATWRPKHASKSFCSPTAVMSVMSLNETRSVPHIALYTPCIDCSQQRQLILGRHRQSLAVKWPATDRRAPGSLGPYRAPQTRRTAERTSVVPQPARAFLTPTGRDPPRNHALPARYGPGYHRLRANVGSSTRSPIHLLVLHCSSLSPPTRRGAQLKAIMVASI